MTLYIAMISTYCSIDNLNFLALIDWKKRRMNKKEKTSVAPLMLDTIDSMVFFYTKLWPYWESVTT